jgi:3-mercaptopyruvate sulfurtransferase SseA
MRFTAWALWFLALAAATGAARADAISAAQARERVAHGALLWDVRADTPAFIPNALRADLRTWQRTRDLAALARAVSDSGIDLSREVVIYGQAGDPAAQALVQTLQTVATGRVHWLVGGVEEWQAAGGELVSQPAVRAPVPQRLVALQSAAHGEPAVPSRRRTSTEGLAVLRVSAVD